MDVKKDDGFSALHLAALNGHRDVVVTLVRAGQADIDLRNNRNQSALLLAVSQGTFNFVVHPIFYYFFNCRSLWCNRESYQIEGEHEC